MFFFFFIIIRGGWDGTEKATKKVGKGQNPRKKYLD